ncbi:DUF2798 domain-containing protein [Aliiglaciecola sp. CAU 1673]|uniref:DUF2798 domain-containing protein n=1 Tax=Aliiglaciecola sp. CAU 1673 TaxID=3032595 RepID=UPI0023DC8E85|nr:DUF2798 domain-containing protein [Aliiglaciecola sp. CAU 1673]MDF2179705.1 DUF2798 domain-containing protein [Aliiglaciecola sp. CAU 1673]
MKLVKKLMVLIPLVLVLIGILTFAMTYKNIGFSDRFFEQWLTSTVWSAATMAPLGFLMIAIVSKLVSISLPSASEFMQNTTIGVLMAVIMEAAMALVTTVNNVGMASLTELMGHWWPAFIVALPVGLLISVFMSLVIKPRLERFLES